MPEHPPKSLESYMADQRIMPTERTGPGSHYEPHVPDMADMPLGEPIQLDMVSIYDNKIRKGRDIRNYTQEELDYSLDEVTQQRNELSKPGFGNYVTEYARKKMEDGGIDFYLKGFPGNWHGDEVRQPDTDLKGIMIGEGEKGVMHGDMWNKRGLVRLDPDNFSGEDYWASAEGMEKWGEMGIESGLSVEEIEGGNWGWEGTGWKVGWKDQDFLDLISGKLGSISEPSRAQFPDSEEDFQEARLEWEEEGKKMDRLLSFIANNKEIGKVLTTKIPTIKAGKGNITNLERGTDNFPGIYRENATVSGVMNNAGRAGVKLYAGMGENHAADIPLAIGKGECGYVGDNMTCISAATGIQTLAARAEEGQGYNNWLKEEGYESYPGEIMGNVYSSGGDFIAANKNAWGDAKHGLKQDKYWDATEYNLSDMTEIASVDEDTGVPVYKWKDGMEPGYGNIIGMWASINQNPQGREYAGRVGHSAILSGKGKMDDLNYNISSLSTAVSYNYITEKDEYKPAWKPTTHQDHTTTSTFSSSEDAETQVGTQRSDDGEFAKDQHFMMAKYKGEKKYQDWLIKQQQTYADRKNTLDERFNDLTADNERRIRKDERGSLLKGWKENGENFLKALGKRFKIDRNNRVSRERVSSPGWSTLGGGALR